MKLYLSFFIFSSLLSQISCSIETFRKIISPLKQTNDFKSLSSVSKEIANAVDFCISSCENTIANNGNVEEARESILTYKTIVLDELSSSFTYLNNKNLSITLQRIFFFIEEAVSKSYVSRVLIFDSSLKNFPHESIFNIIQNLCPEYSGEKIMQGIKAILKRINKDVAKILTEKDYSHEWLCSHICRTVESFIFPGMTVDNVATARAIFFKYFADNVSHFETFLIRNDKSDVIDLAESILLSLGLSDLKLAKNIESCQSAKSNESCQPVQNNQSSMMMMDTSVNPSQNRCEADSITQIKENIKNGFPKSKFVEFVRVSGESTELSITKFAIDLFLDDIRQITRRFNDIFDLVHNIHSLIEKFKISNLSASILMKFKRQLHNYYAQFFPEYELLTGSPVSKFNIEEEIKNISASAIIKVPISSIKIPNRVAVEIAPNRRAEIAQIIEVPASDEEILQDSSLLIRLVTFKQRFPDADENIDAKLARVIQVFKTFIEQNFPGSSDALKAITNLDKI